MVEKVGVMKISKDDEVRLKILRKSFISAILQIKQLEEKIKEYEKENKMLKEKK